MPNYRRVSIPGGRFFFTVNLLDRRTKLLTENIGALRAAYGGVAKRHAFETIAICVLPEHLHCVWRLPPDDPNYPLRWRLIKSRFSKSLLRERDPRAGVSARVSASFFTVVMFFPLASRTARHPPIGRRRASGKNL